jgi:hypothetical protein
MLGKRLDKSSLGVNNQKGHKQDIKTSVNITYA